MLGLGFGSVVALDYAARHPPHPAALVLAAPVARIVPERSIAVYERLGGAAAREVAERFYDGMDEQAFADFLRVCFPLLSSYALTSDVIVRADWNPDVLMEWMRGEAEELDLRDELAGDPRAGARAGRRGRRLGAARVRARGRTSCLGGHKRFRSYPDGRHSVFRDAPAAYEDLRRLPRRRPGARAALVKVAVDGIELFFDVDGAKVLLDGPWARDRPTVILLPTGPGIDHSLYKEQLGPALAHDAQVVYLDLRGAGRSDWSSPEHWTLETWVDDLAEFCDALELRGRWCSAPAIGGLIALLYAARHPERVERLVLVSVVARYVHTRVIASSTASAARRPARSPPATSPSRPSATSPSSCASACRSTRARRCPPKRSRGSR